MKKTMTLLLAITLLCSGISAMALAGEEKAKPAKKYVIGFASLSRTQDWVLMVEEGIKKEAEEAGYELFAVDNDFSDSKAISNADAMVARKVDFFIEFNIHAALNARIKEMMDDAGIPVIFVDIPGPDSPFYGVPNHELGAVAGRELGKYVKNNWGGEFDYFVLVDAPAVGETNTQRMKGIEDGLLEILPNADRSKFDRVDGQANTEGGLEAMATWLTGHPNAHRVIVSGINDSSVVGALRAVEAAGRSDDVVLYGLGLEPIGKEELMKPENSYKGTVYVDPWQYGKDLIRLATKVFNGESIPDVTNAEVLLPVTRENVDEY
jgi:ABC-type sugar transport system substrate-binding protein